MTMLPKTMDTVRQLRQLVSVIRVGSEGTNQCVGRFYTDYDGPSACVMGAAMLGLGCDRQDLKRRGWFGPMNMMFRRIPILGNSANDVSYEGVPAAWPKPLYYKLVEMNNGTRRPQRTREFICKFLERIASIIEHQLTPAQATANTKEAVTVGA